jgi:hypothetical protein
MLAALRTLLAVTASDSGRLGGTFTGDEQVRYASRGRTTRAGCVRWPNLSGSLRLAILVLAPLPASAFVVTIDKAPAALYLQVGNGSFSGFYNAGGTPGTSPAVNLVSVTVPSAALLTGGDQQMTSNSTQAVSFYDGRIFCAPPSQVYLGGFYRVNNQGNRTAVLSVTSPPSLVSAAGDTIPFSQIRWTSSAGTDAAQPVLPDGSFIAGGTQFLAGFRRNTWRETCLTFFYRNDPATAGTYEGRVTYTLTAP